MTGSPRNRDFTEAFADALHAARKRTGMTQKQMAATIAIEQIRRTRQPHGLTRETAVEQAKGRWERKLSAWKTGSRLPQDQGELLAAIGLIDPDGMRTEWVQLWGRAFTGRARPEDSAEVTSMLGVALEHALAAGPIAYEVHPAICPNLTDTCSLGVGVIPETPTYVSRRHDRDLAEIVKAAADGDRRIAVLVGGSSTGKTRACWEVLSLLHERGGWRLWHPLTPQQLVAGLQPAPSGPVLATRTVIWLNELQRYLLPADPVLGEQVAVALRDLLANPRHGAVLVLGTIWPDLGRWATLTSEPVPGQPDPHAQARDLLTNAGIVVPDQIGDDRAAVDQAATTDPRWRLALEQAPDRPVQFLAGAAYLLQRYNAATPTARAILDTAGDARRVGVPILLPLPFLEQAAQDYLSDAEWRSLPRGRRSTWVRDTIEDPVIGLAIGGRGVDGPLREPRTSPIREGSDVPDAGYELADYLEQHLRLTRMFVQPRDSLWMAAAASFTSPDVLAAIARAAEARGRFWPAVHLYMQASTTGEPKALNGLAWRLEQAGYHERAEQLADQAANAGHVEILRQLAFSRRLRAEAEGADTRSAERMASRAEAVWEDQVRRAIRWVRAQGEDPATLRNLAGVQHVKQLAERTAGSGDAEAQHVLAWLPKWRAWAVPPERPIKRVIRAQSAEGNNAADKVARLQRLAADTGEDEELYLQRALAAGDDGSPEALIYLALLRQQAGDEDGAKRTRRFGIVTDGSPDPGW